MKACIKIKLEVYTKALEYLNQIDWSNYLTILVTLTLTSQTK